MSTPGSRVNEARLGLLTILSVLEDATTSVVDSTVAGRALKTRAVVVGTQVGAQKVLQQAMGSNYGEHIRIACVLIAASGSKDPASRWDEAALLFDSVETLLRADPSLGGACQHSVLGDETVWTPISDENGSSLNVDFVVVTQKDG